MGADFETQLLQVRTALVRVVGTMVVIHGYGKTMLGGGKVGFGVARHGDLICSDGYT
jgi:hypothetical protein